MSPTCEKVDDTLPGETPEECQRCGQELDEGEGYWAEGWESDVCEECFLDTVVTCQLSGEEDVMPSDVSPFIVVKTELCTPPGIYRVLRRPFLLCAMVGGTSLMRHSVRFVAPLPRPDHTFEISGNICRKAAEPYRKLYRKIYGTKAWGQGAYGRHLDKIEHAHIRATILANPDMLRDLECDKDHYKFLDLREDYDLPDGLPTYHEWLAVEHKGVKVFFSYRDLWDSWFTLSPLPKHRYCRGERRLTFAATCLPTWKSDGRDRFYRDHRSCSTKAIIAAIDAGLLTQEGCRDAAGKATYYG
jgi:hypothetical protein